MALSTTTFVNVAACLISTVSGTPSSENSKPKLLPFPFHEPLGFEAQEHYEDISVDTDEKFRHRCFTFIGEVFPGMTKIGKVTSKEDAIDFAEKIVPLCKDPSYPRCSVWAHDLVATRDADQHKEWCDEMLIVSKNWQAEGVPSASQEHSRRVKAQATVVDEIIHNSRAVSTASPVSHDVLEVAKQTELQAADLDEISKQLDAVSRSRIKKTVKAAAHVAATAASNASGTTSTAADVATPVAAEKAPKAPAKIVTEQVTTTHAAVAVAITIAPTTTLPRAAEVDNELDRLDTDLSSLDHSLVKNAIKATSTPTPRTKDLARSFQNASSKVVVQAIPKYAETHLVEHKKAKAIDVSGQSSSKLAKATAAPDVDRDLVAMDHLLDGVDNQLKKANSDSKSHQTPSPKVSAPASAAVKAASVASTTLPPAKLATGSPVHHEPVSELKSFGGKSTEVQHKFLTPAKSPEVDKELDAVTHDLEIVDHQLFSANKEGASQLKAFGVPSSVPVKSVANDVVLDVPSSHASKDSVPSKNSITPSLPQAEPHTDLTSFTLKEDERENCECNVREGQKVCHCHKGSQVWTTSEHIPGQVVAPQSEAEHAAVPTSWFSHLFR